MNIPKTVGPNENYILPYILSYRQSQQNRQGNSWLLTLLTLITVIKHQTDKRLPESVFYICANRRNQAPIERLVSISGFKQIANPST